MKVAVSIPDPVFQKAEALAKRLKVSRSKVYAKALDEFVLNHSPDELTEIANKLADEMDDEMKEEIRMWTAAGARTVIKHSEW